MLLIIVGLILFLYSVKVLSVIGIIISCLLVLVGVIMIETGSGGKGGGFDFDD